MDVSGQCFCGEIAYSATIDPNKVVVCHCTDCQTQSTAGFGMSMPVPRDAVECDFARLASWDRQAASGRIVKARFCPTCGTRIFHEPSRNPNILNVKPGTLDDTSWVKPVAHLWLGSAQPWFSPPSDLLTYDGQPDSFDDAFERFRSSMS